MALGDLIEFNIHCVSNKIQFEEVTCYSSCIYLSEFFYVIRRKFGVNSIGINSIGIDPIR